MGWGKCGYSFSGTVGGFPTVLWASADIISQSGLISYQIGIWTLVLQIVTYCIMQEPDTLRIPITIVAGFSVLPLLAYAQ